jgi:hypothetical protein
VGEEVGSVTESMAPAGNSRRRALLAGAFAGMTGVALGAAIEPAAAVDTPPLDWQNVVDHGAVGDGAADDTAAIQAAINAIPRGGVVYFPSGTYKISSALTVTSGLTFRGTGPQSSFVVQSSTTADGFSGTDLLFVTFESMSIDGPGSGSGTGVHFTVSAHPATQYTTMRNCMVKNWGSDGINIVLPMVSYFHGVIAQTNGGYGFNIHSNADTGPAGTSCQFTSCYANANALGGYRLHKLTYSQLSGCAADDNPIGYELDLPCGISLNGCGAEVNGTGIMVNGGSVVSLNAVYFYGSKGTCVEIANGAQAVSISGLAEVEPAAAATSCVTTDATSFAILSGISNIKPNDLAGPCQVLSDTAGAMSVHSSLTAAGAVTLNDGLVVQGYSYLGGPVEAAQHLISDAGNVVMNGVGFGLTIKEGTNARMGVSTLSGGTVTVHNTTVTAHSRIILSGQNSSGTPGNLYVGSRTVGTSFTITSTSTSDTREIAWILVEPS